MFKNNQFEINSVFIFKKFAFLPPNPGSLGNEPVSLKFSKILTMRVHSLINVFQRCY